MKKLLFSAYSMDLGGIETALLTLINYLANSYEITLVLEKKQGMFLERLDKRINILGYSPNENKNTIIRKFFNLINRLKFILKYKNKFDFSASFATYSCAGAFVARTASKNNALWVHADYMDLYKNDEQKFRDFFEERNYNKFKKIVFVAESAKESFLKIYPKAKNKAIFCNNMIDYNKIIEKSNEPIDDVKKEDIYTFVNVGRHDELQKKLTRIIEATRILKDDGLKFRVIFVGDGKDYDLYKKMIKEYKLDEFITLVGRKDNPYPYMKLSDAVILTSDYEGYPVVFIEAKTLNKPVITTDISDAKTDIENKCGVVTTKSPLDVYRAMKAFIETGYEIKEEFKPEQYNSEIIRKVDEIINQK